MVGCSGFRVVSIEVVKAPGVVVVVTAMGVGVTGAGRGWMQAASRRARDETNKMHFRTRGLCIKGHLSGCELVRLVEINPNGKR
jgi:hypothetical protein